jgi:hypothetical protein
MMAGFNKQLLHAEDRGYRRGFKDACDLSNSTAAYERILRMGIRRMFFAADLRSPIVLKGTEGIILRDLLLLMANDGVVSSVAGHVFVNGRPVVCEHQANKVAYHGYVS